jgi:hypothetical protein
MSPIDTSRIVATLDERKRWEQRRKDLESEMRFLSGDEKKVKKQELAKVDEQIAYYDSLLGEMKKELRPSDRSAILTKGG